MLNGLKTRPRAGEEALLDHNAILRLCKGKESSLKRVESALAISV